MASMRRVSAHLFDRLQRVGCARIRRRSWTSAAPDCIAGLDFAMSTRRRSCTAALERGLLINRTATTVDPAAAAVHRDRAATWTRRMAILEDAIVRRRSVNSPLTTSSIGPRRRPTPKRFTRSSRAHQAKATCCRASSRRLPSRGRFVVCDVDGEIKACAELAPLSSRVAEVRSLVVSGTSGAWAWPPGWSANCGARAGARDSRRSARSRTMRGSSFARTSRSCRTSGCRRRSRRTASAARCSVAAGSTPWCCRSLRCAPLRRRADGDPPRRGRLTGQSRDRASLRAASPRPPGSGPRASACGIKKRGPGTAPLDLALISSPTARCRPPPSSRRTRPSPRRSSSRASTSRAPAAARRP